MFWFFFYGVQLGDCVVFSSGSSHDFAGSYLPSSVLHCSVQQAVFKLLVKMPGDLNALLPLSIT